MQEVIESPHQHQQEESFFLGELIGPGESVDIAESCHDCGKSVRVRASMEDSQTFQLRPCDGNAVYEVAPDWVNPKPFFKCAECYQRDPVLRRFRNTEIYTRVVGYYQRLDRFNRGKSEEYRHRRNFTL